MKTFSTDGRIPLRVLSDSSSESAHHANDPLSPEEHAWNADKVEALATAWARPRFVNLPGREPLDLEAISDLWLD
jgi:hypothetical protein